MSGFIFGIACLIGLKWALRCGRSRGFGCARDGCGQRGRRGRRWSFRSRLWEALDHLDTSPGQEKAIRAHIAAVVEQAHEARRSLSRSVEHLARAMRGDAFDESAASEAAAAQTAALEELRDALLRALAGIHEVLDSGQRERLAEILTSASSRRRPFGGPYR